MGNRAFSSLLFVGCLSTLSAFFVACSGDTTSGEGSLGDDDSVGQADATATGNDGSSIVVVDANASTEDGSSTSTEDASTTDATMLEDASTTDATMLEDASSTNDSGIADSGIDSGVDAAPPPSFTVALDVSTVRLVKGGTANVQVTLTRDTGFSEAVNLTTTVLPTGVTASPVQIAAGATTGQLTLSSTFTGGLESADAAVVATSATSAVTKQAPLHVYSRSTPSLLDTSFGTNGVRTYALGRAADSIAASAVQADGKIVVVGSAASGANTRSYVARLTSTGALDTTYGQGGIVKIPQSGGTVTNVVLQPDGKALIAYTDNVVRLTTAGAYDTTFGANGAAPVVGLRSPTFLAVQPDNKIVAFGAATNGQGFLTARLNSDGTFDPDFGTFGTNTLATYRAVPTGIALDMSADGLTLNAIVIGGILQGSALSDGRCNYLRYSPVDGSVLKSWNVLNQITCSTFTSKAGVLTSMGANPGVDLRIRRYLSDGSADGTFGTGGAIDMPMATIETVGKVRVDANGKFVVSGSVKPTLTTSDSVVWRINSDGSLDTTYGNSGTFSTSASSGVERLTSMTLDASGNALATGYADDDGAVGWSHGTIMRISSTGTTDNTFDGDGIAAYNLGIPDSTLYVSAKQADGKVLVGGFLNWLTNTSAGAESLVARLLPSGDLDPSFGGGAGFVVLNNYPGVNEETRALAVQSDGKIVVTTKMTSAAGFSVTRLNSDGSVDTAGFGTNGTVQRASASNVGGMVIQANGKIVVATIDANNVWLTRFTSAGVLDTSGTAGVGFGNTGALFTDFGGIEGIVFLAQASDGHLIAGTSRTVGANAPNTQDWGVALYKDTGELDTSFGTNGIYIGNLANAETLRGVAAGPNGTIGVFGYATKATRDLFVMALTSAGVPDPTFNGGAAKFLDSTTSDTTVAGFFSVDQRYTGALGCSSKNGGLFSVLPDGSIDSAYPANGLQCNDIAGSSQSAIQMDGAGYLLGIGVRSDTYGSVATVARYFP